MSKTLSEEEMRAALFGDAAGPVGGPIQHQPQPRAVSATKTHRVKRLSSRLRVTMRVAREFEGEEEVFVHDANTLSTLIAEAEAKTAAKKKKYRYFDVISVTPVQV
ncbi:hypothetical protein ACIPZF_12140 [Pseudomonas sp. NPDC089752]|uniref:hypothetical protein n=1 Tax=Pseudomonas sp. NPDC089752 TaxID=3364472 RepID=UPI0037FFAF0E